MRTKPFTIKKTVKKNIAALEVCLTAQEVADLHAVLQGADFTAGVDDRGLRFIEELTANLDLYLCARFRGGPEPRVETHGTVDLEEVEK